MKKKIQFIIPISILLIALLSCGKAKKDDDDDKLGARLLALLILSNSGQDPDPVGTSIEQSLNSSTSAMESTTSDGASIATIQNESILDLFQLKLDKILLYSKLMTSELHAASFTSTYNCLGGGTISRNIEASSQPFSGTGPTTFYGKRTFSDCILFRASRFIQSGTREVYWNNLATASPYIQIGTTMNVALNRTITDKIRGFSIKVTGNGSAITNGTEKVTSEASWTAAGASTSTYTVNVLESRVGTNSRGSTIFDHTITTPTVLTHVISGSGSSRRRTVNGSIKVIHNILKFETLTTFKDVVWDASTCKPVSGEATVEVTGSRTATGKVTFTTDSASYSYSGSSGSGSGEIEFSGCTSSI